MNFSTLDFIPMIILAITSVFLLISQNWRWSIAALAIQYLAAFWLVAQVWPLSLAVVKVIAGWMAGALLSASRPENDLLEERSVSIVWPLFRMLAAGLVLLLVFSVAPQLQTRLPLPLVPLLGGLILIGIGLLHLGMTTRPLRVILGLLTTYLGFEIIYAGLETSILIAGLLAAVTLGLAFVGAYLLTSVTMEEGA